MSWLRESLESREPLVELRDLEERGLVRIDVLEVLHCDSDEQQMLGHSCGGWSPPGDSYGEPMACETCGRIFDGEEEPEPLHVLTLDRDAIASALQQSLGDKPRRLDGGVAWTVEGDRDDVLVVVADWSDGTRWMTNRTLRGRPFVLVQVDVAVTASRLGVEPWVVTVELLEVLRNPDVLLKAIRHAESLADEPRAGDAIVELHRLQSKVVHRVRGAHLVELTPDAIRVDAVEVPMASGMKQVVAYLVDRHIEDVRDGKDPADHCTWSLAELSDALEIPRTTVQKQLRRFRDRLADRYAAEAHRPLPEGSVLELEGNGWRFSANCLVRRSA